MPLFTSTLRSHLDTATRRQRLSPSTCERTKLQRVPVAESCSSIDELVTRFARLFRGRRPKKLLDLPTGWYELVVELFMDIGRLLDDRTAERFEVLEVSERFAGLRIRWRLIAQPINVIDLFGARRTQRPELERKHPTALFERVRARVNQAAVQASKTCQVCGQPGSSENSKGWLRTLCGACSQPQRANRLDRRQEFQRDGSRS